MEVQAPLKATTFGWLQCRSNQISLRNSSCVPNHQRWRQSQVKQHRAAPTEQTRNATNGSGETRMERPQATAAERKSHFRRTAMVISKGRKASELNQGRKSLIAHA